MLLAWILAAALGAENPCTNGSFEDLAPNGFPADWGPVGTKVEVSAEAHSGRRALRFVRHPGTDPRIETGLNRIKLLDRLQGGMEFWYKAVSAKDANLRVYAIPINADGVEKTNSSRAAFTVPTGHIGDGQWHRGRIKYDFTKDPKVKSLHFAVRIEGAAGELLVDDFAYLDRVGPVLRFGRVRLDEDPKRPGLLYAGTDAGVYVSLTRGESWLSLCADLPTTPVMDLVVHPREDELVIATHGRSLFLLDVRPVQALIEAVQASDLHLFDVRPVRLAWQPGRELPPQPPRGRALLHAWLKTASSVEVSIHDAERRPVRTMSVEGAAGVNRFEWDIRRDDGRDASPGVYRAELTAGNRKAAGDIVVAPGRR
jgi:hypothetical protein